MNLYAAVARFKVRNNTWLFLETDQKRYMRSVTMSAALAFPSQAIQGPKQNS
jgi:hypothetical protein